MGKNILGSESREDWDSGGRNRLSRTEKLSIVVGAECGEP